MNINSNDTGASSNDNGANEPSSNPSTVGAVPASPAVQFSHDVNAESAAADAEKAGSTAEADASPLVVDGGVTKTTALVEASTAVSAVKELTFTVDGVVKGTTTVPLGTKVKDALKKVAASMVATTLSIRDAAGKAVGLDRVLNESMVVTAVAKASGG